MICLEMSLIELIQFEVWSASWIFRFVFLEIWENLAISSLNSLSPSLGLWWVLDLFYCPVSPWSSVTFKNIFSFCCSYWENSIYLSSNSWILTSVFMLLSHPATVLFLQFYFSALEFLFFITYFHVEIFSFFICFKRIYDWLLKDFYDVFIKILVIWF